VQVFGSPLRDNCIAANCTRGTSQNTACSIVAAVKSSNPTQSVSSSDCTSSNGGMISDKRHAKDVDGSGRSILCCCLTFRNYTTPKYKAVRRVDIGLSRTLNSVTIFASSVM
jgi:hypothetical protein